MAKLYGVKGGTNLSDNFLVDQHATGIGQHVKVMGRFATRRLNGSHFSDIVFVKWTIVH